VYKYLSFWNSPDALYNLGVALKLAAVLITLLVCIVGWRESALRKRSNRADAAAIKASIERQVRRIDRIKYGAGAGGGHDAEDML
jgi:hypothetical protein